MVLSLCDSLCSLAWSVGGGGNCGRLRFTKMVTSLSPSLHALLDLAIPPSRGPPWTWVGAFVWGRSEIVRLLRLGHKNARCFHLVIWRRSVLEPSYQAVKTPTSLCRVPLAEPGVWLGSTSVSQRTPCRLPHVWVKRSLGDFCSPAVHSLPIF